MKTFWIYVRAIGLVFSRRLKKAMENKRNIMFVLGTVAVILVCVGGSCLLHTLSDMNAMGNSKNIVANASEFNKSEMSTKDENTSLIEETKEERTTESAELALADMQNLADEEVPLTMEPGKKETADVQHWKILMPIHSSASSVLQSDSGKSYDVNNLLDHDNKTTWQEGEEGDGIGTSLSFSFPEDSKLCGFSIVNGNGTSETKYQENNRCKDLTIMIGTEQVPYTLEDTFGEQFVSFENLVDCKDIMIKIDGVYAGTKYDDTCISEINFFTMN